MIAYMRTPEGAAVFSGAAVDGVNQAGAQNTPAMVMTAAQEAAMLRFSATPGGIAWNNHSGEFNQLMNEIGETAVNRAGDRLRVRLAHDVCEVIGNQCPVPMRAAGASAN